MHLALNVSEREVGEIRALFVQLDADGNGLIDRREMLQGLKALQEKTNVALTQAEVEAIFDAMDFDRSDAIDYSEFIACFLDCCKRHESFFRREFDKLDLDRDGRLAKQDIEGILHADTISLGHLHIDTLIHEADLDGDGKISYHEFLALLRTNTSQLEFKP